MEKYLSQRHLNKLYTKEHRKLGKFGIQEKVNKKKYYGGGSSSGTTIFLSHSHRDKTIVSKIGLLFDQLDINLYIDWLDTSLPESTNAHTADAIKRKIRKCDKFLFLATYRGLKSKWCNWELGIADSMKNQNHLAILPIETSSGNWYGNEYLNLYPEMKVSGEDLDNLNAEKITIYNNINRKTLSFREWITS